MLCSCRAKANRSHAIEPLAGNAVAMNSGQAAGGGKARGRKQRAEGMLTARAQHGPQE